MFPGGSSGFVECNHSTVARVLDEGTSAGVDDAA